MALRAGNRDMSPGKRKGCLCVIESASPANGRCSMALQAIRSEARSHVGGSRCRVILRPVTCIAVRRHAHVFVLLLIDVTGLAWGRHVGAKEREPGAVVALRHIRHQPCRRRVASIAGGAKLAPVNVLVAIGALGRCATEFQTGVALPAIQTNMQPFEPEPRGVMVEL
jgi:hypothetical protein